MKQNLVDVIQEISDALETAQEDKKPALVKSIIMIMKQIAKTVDEFNDIPETYSQKLHPAMLAQMKAAERRTEEATDKFLTISEKIGAVLKDVPEPAKATIQNSLNEIFETSSFQDLVAQHLNEIRLLIDDLTYDIESLDFAIKSLTSEEAGQSVQRTIKTRRPDDHLLNGPATDF